MRNLSDEKLDKMLSDYCDAAPEQSFVYTPQAREEKVIPFVRYRRIAAAAASLVLVSVLSITIYFLLGNKIDTPIAVAPSPRSVTTPSTPTGESDGVPIEDQPSGTEATGDQSPIERLINSIFRKSDSTQSGGGTSPTTDRNGATTAPTEKSTSGEMQNGTENPTEYQSQPTTAPTDPPITPTTPAATAPPRVEPTEDDPHDPPWIDDPTEGGGSSGNPGSDDPSYENPVLEAEIYDEIDVSLWPADNAVYCKLFDSDGNLLDDDLYAYSHRGSIVQVNGDSILVKYKTPSWLIPSSGFYTYVFYDTNGNVLTQGQVYVS